MSLLKVSAFLFLVRGSACNQDSESKNIVQEVKVKNTTVNYCLTYPKIIHSLNLQSLYDSARWQLYTWHCDKTYMFKKDTAGKEKRTFGLLPLKFDSCVIKSDTIDFLFDFVDGNDTVKATELREYVHIKNGVGFNVKTKRKLYLISLNNYTLIEKGKASRFENSLQPEVNKYIDSNWYRIDPCFKILAEKKRGSK